MFLKEASCTHFMVDAGAQLLEKGQHSGLNSRFLMHLGKVPLEGRTNNRNTVFQKSLRGMENGVLFCCQILVGYQEKRK